MIYGGFLTVGDSTATDGFVSTGYTNVPNDTLRLLDKDLADLGNLDLNQGTLQMPHGGRIQSGFTLNSLGSATDSRVEGDLVNEGTINFAANHNLDCTGKLVQVSGTTTGSGLLHMLPGSSLSTHGAAAPQLLLEGSLAFSLSPTRMNVGFLAASGAAVMHFNVGSRASGNWDTLVVSGSAQLLGALALQTGPESVPHLGDTLTIITAGSVVGSFSSVTVNGAPGAGQVSVIYTPTAVKVVVTGTIAGISPDPRPQLASGPRLTSVGTLGRPQFELQLSEPSQVRLIVYDVSGREQAVLARGALPVGTFRFEVPGSLVPSEMLFARAEVRGSSSASVLRARAVKLR